MVFYWSLCVSSLFKESTQPSPPDPASPDLPAPIVSPPMEERVEPVRPHTHWLIIPVALLVCSGLTPGSGKQPLAFAMITSPNSYRNSHSLWTRSQHLREAILSSCPGFPLLVTLKYALPESLSPADWGWAPGLSLFIQPSGFLPVAGSNCLATITSHLLQGPSTWLLPAVNGPTPPLPENTPACTLTGAWGQPACRAQWSSHWLAISNPQLPWVGRSWDGMLVALESVTLAFRAEAAPSGTAQAFLCFYQEAVLLTTGSYYLT